MLKIQEVQEIINPELAHAIARACIQAFQDWFSEVSDKARAVCCPTTKANFINDHMIHHARTLLGKHPDVRFCPRNGREHLFVKEVAEIKLKKLNHNRRPSNIPTRAALDYDEQIPLPMVLPYQSELPNVLYPITNLIAGYQANRLKTGVEAVYIVCPEGRKNKWEWRIDFEPQPISTEETEPRGNRAPKTLKTIVPKKDNAKNIVRDHTHAEKAK